MKNLKKTLGIFLALTMLLTMIPTFALAEVDYDAIVNEISFADFKDTNAGGQFNITADLVLSDSFVASDGENYNVSWSSSDESVITSAGVVTTTTSKLDRWVTITAKIENASKSFKLRVKGTAAAEDILFNEDFDTMTAGAFTNTDKAAEGMNGWYVEGTPENAETEFTVISTDDDADGNTMELTATSVQDPRVYLQRDISLPTSGLVEFSADVKSKNSENGLFCVFWPVWGVKKEGEILYPAYYNNSSVKMSFKDDEWQHFSAIYDITNKKMDAYVDGELVFSKANFSSSEWNYTISNYTKFQARMTGGSYAGAKTSFDNIEVKKLTFDAEADALAVFNPVNQESRYKDSVYVNSDLKNSITIGNDTYDVTYVSSDESVIASDGSVTLPEFFRTVSVTPQIKVGTTTLTGEAISLTVLPVSSNYTEKLYEDFEGIGVITEAVADSVDVGDMFDANGAPVDASSGWTLTNTTSYRTEWSNGGRIQIVSDDNNSVLKMKRTANNVDYRIQTAMSHNNAFGDRIAVAIRIKNIGNYINIAGSYMGCLNITRGFRGDFAKVSTDTDQAISHDKDWHTYLFVYDKGITETKKNADAYPVTLYRDGVLVGTSWARTTNYTGDTLFQLLQWAEYQASEIYVDDILVMNLDADPMQFADSTVENGILKTAGIQYNSYEQNIGTSSMSLIVASYDSNDDFIGAKVVNATPDKVGINDVNVEYTLPTATDYYRLFLFDGLTNIKPLSLSKIYNIAE